MERTSMPFSDYIDAVITALENDDWKQFEHLAKDFNVVGGFVYAKIDH